jgi:ABC-type transport system substrate-binding protein
VFDKSTFPRLQQVSTLTTFVEPAVFGSFQLMPNFRKTKSPIQDIRFRQAMLYALPRDEITKSLRLGLSVPVPNLIYSPPYLEGVQLTDFSYNPDKAKQLLADMNYDTSQELVFVYQQSDKGPEEPAIQQALQDVGIKTKLVVVQDSAAIAEYLKDPEAWDFYLEYWSHGADPADVIAGLPVCQGPKYDPCDWVGFNWTATPRYLELMKAQAKELDPTKRKAQIQEIIGIVDKELPSIPLWTEPNVYFISKRAHGTANGIYRYGVWSFNETAPETWWLDPK